MKMEADSSVLACRGDSSAWELAKSRFVNDLEPSERQLYNNATVENLYYATSNNVRSDGVNSRSRIVIRKLGPLVSAIQSYGSAMDTFAQIAPLYLSPIWGSIRVLLVAAETYSKFYDRIVDVLARVGDILPRFRDYERIYNPQKHARLTQALSNSYLDIITLCTQFRCIIREHRASKIRRLLKPLSVNQQFDEAIETFRRHKQNVEDEAKLCHMIEVSEEREARMTVYAAERRKRLLARLSKVDCQHRHRKLQGKRHEGTGLWMSQHAEYMNWESTELKSAVLCCHGIPGCGKSVLASTIVDSMKNNRQAIFYYCDYVDKRTLHPESIFGTLARQILEQEETIAEPLALAIEQADHDGERLRDHGQALNILQLCSETLLNSLTLILDGLDECTEPSQKVICDGLRHLLHRDELSIKLYITARADLTSFLKLEPTVPVFDISVSTDAIALDIDSYVRASTRRRISDGSLAIQDPNLEEVIVSKLVIGAKGMFLWVEFQLNDLCDAESDCSIKIVLENLPRSLSETYDRLLSKIEGTERAAMIEKMFKWLVCARQPLHVSELRECVVFTLKDTQWDRDKIVTDLTRLVRACSNLVIIDPETRIVQLSHYTVEQYLVQNDEARFHFTRQEAETMAGEFCIAYLSFTDFESRVIRYKQNINTDLLALGNFAQRRLLVSPYHPGQVAVKAWNILWPPGPSPTDPHMAQFSSRRPKAPDVAQFSCLPYIITYWLSHTSNILDQMPTTSDGYKRAKRLYQDLVMEKDLPFKFRPWADFLPAENTLIDKALLGWGLMSNNASLVTLARELASSQNASNLDEQLNDFDVEINQEICQAFLDKLPSSARKLALAENSFEDEITTDAFYTCEMPITSWLCSRYVWACRKGHVQAIKASRVFEVAGDRSHIFLECCASEAAINGQLRLLKYLESTINLGQLSGFLNPLIPSSQFLALNTRPPYHLNTTEHCVLFGHPEAALFLFTQGQRFQLFTDDDGFYALLYENIGRGMSEVVEKLLRLRSFLQEASGWSSISEGDRATGPLNIAARRGSFNDVESLLKYGISANVPNRIILSPLLNAILGSHIEIVKVLLEYQANTAATPFGLPLAVAAGIGNIAIVELLLSCSSVSVVDNDHGDDFPSMGCMTEDGRTPQLHLSPTPLYMACYNGHFDVVRLLVGRGASPFLPSPSMHIRLSQQGEVVRTVHPLFSSDDPMRQFQRPQKTHYPMWKTPLSTAKSQGHEDIVVFLQTLKSTTHANKAQPISILDTTLFGKWRHILGPFTDTQIAHIVLEFLIHIGVDLRQCYSRGQSVILWALENKTDALRLTIPDDLADILLYAVGELVMLSSTSTAPSRTFKVFWVIVQLYDKHMLYSILYRLLIRESQESAADVFFDVFSYIICSLDVSPDSRDIDIANMILQAIYDYHKVDTSYFRCLDAEEIRALKVHCGNANSPENLRCLEEIFHALCIDNSSLVRHLVVEVARKYRKNFLIEALGRTSFLEPSSARLRYG